MPMLVTPVSDYDILISLDHLITLGAVIDCQTKSIDFSNCMVRLHGDGQPKEFISAMTKPE